MPNFSGVWNLKDQVQAIAAGRWTGLPLPELYAWGNNSLGHLGTDSTVSVSSPVQVGSLTDWAEVSVGSYAAGALKTNNTLWTWGANGDGAVGDGTTITRSSPVQIGALTDWIQISICGDSASNQIHSLAVRSNGALYAWGRNNYGQLGINVGDYSSRSSPTQVGGLTNWARVAKTNGPFSLAIKTDGTLWAWGRNNDGQLGQNSTSNYIASPVQIGGLTNWVSVSGQREVGHAINTNGEMFSWGNSLMLGDNTVVSKSSPVQIGALTNWSQVSGMQNGALALKTDGTLWAWGINSSGRLGDGTTINRSSPVQIGALTNWVKIAAARYAGFAIKDNGTLWSWGLNSNGILGDGATVNKSSPVQIGSGTNWSEVSGSRNSALAIFQGSSN